MPKTLYTMFKYIFSRTARVSLLIIKRVIKWMKMIVKGFLRFLKKLKSRLFGDKKRERKLEEE